MVTFPSDVEIEEYDADEIKDAQLKFNVHDLPLSKESISNLRKQTVFALKGTRERFLTEYGDENGHICNQESTNIMLKELIRWETQTMVSLAKDSRILEFITDMKRIGIFICFLVLIIIGLFSATSYVVLKAQVSLGVDERGNLVNIKTGENIRFGDKVYFHSHQQVERSNLSQNLYDYSETTGSSRRRLTGNISPHTGEDALKHMREILVNGTEFAGLPCMRNNESDIRKQEEEGRMCVEFFSVRCVDFKEAVESIKYTTRTIGFQICTHGVDIGEECLAQFDVDMQYIGGFGDEAVVEFWGNDFIVDLTDDEFSIPGQCKVKLITDKKSGLDVLEYMYGNGTLSNGDDDVDGGERRMLGFNPVSYKCIAFGGAFSTWTFAQTIMGHFGIEASPFFEIITYVMHLMKKKLKCLDYQLSSATVARKDAKKKMKKAMKQTVKDESLEYMENEIVAKIAPDPQCHWSGTAPWCGWGQPANFRMMHHTCAGKGAPCDHWTDDTHYGLRDAYGGGSYCWSGWKWWVCPTEQALNHETPQCMQKSPPGTRCCDYKLSPVVCWTIADPNTPNYFGKPSLAYG